MLLLFLKGLTFDLDPNSEVDVDIVKVPLHQDIIPLFPGGQGGFQITGAPPTAVARGRIM